MNMIFKITDNEEFISSLQPQLINRTQNAALLSQCPHTDVTPEIAAIAVSGNDRTPVTCAEATEHHLTQNEILLVAIQNQTDQPYQMTPIADILRLSSEESGPVQLLVLTNQRAILGSSEMLNPVAMDEASYRLGSPQLYVIPSSTHEVLLLSHDSGITPDTLDTIIQSVNAQVVAPQDRLADHTLIYDSRTRSLSEAHDRHSRTQESDSSLRSAPTPDKSVKKEPDSTSSDIIPEDSRERRHRT